MRDDEPDGLGVPDDQTAEQGHSARPSAELSRRDAWTLSVTSVILALCGLVVAYDAQDPYLGSVVMALVLICGHKAYPSVRDTYRAAFGPAMVAIVVGWLWFAVIAGATVLYAIGIGFRVLFS
jgi:hypothetical protein